MSEHANIKYLNKKILCKNEKRKENNNPNIYADNLKHS